MHNLAESKTVANFKIPIMAVFFTKIHKQNEATSLMQLLCLLSLSISLDALV